MTFDHNKYMDDMKANSSVFRLGKNSYFHQGDDHIDRKKIMPSVEDYLGKEHKERSLSHWVQGPFSCKEVAEAALNYELDEERKFWERVDQTTAKLDALDDKDAVKEVADMIQGRMEEAGQTLSRGFLRDKEDRYGFTTDIGKRVFHIEVEAEPAEKYWEEFHASMVPTQSQATTPQEPAPVPQQAAK